MREIPKNVRAPGKDRSDRGEQSDIETSYVLHIVSVSAYAYSGFVLLHQVVHCR